MKTCSTCFRYREDSRDALAKGYKKVACQGVVGEYSRKPRPGVKPHAIGLGCPKDDEIRPDYPACAHHEYRWMWNIRTWWEWHFKDVAITLIRKYIYVPIGGLRKPVQLKWKDTFDGIADRMIPNGEPECPHCGNMPYSLSQCVFCGQRFFHDETRNDKTAPQRKKREDELMMFADGICPECGCSCGNGGYGPLRCRCGWVGAEPSAKLKEVIEELFAEDA